MKKSKYSVAHAVCRIALMAATVECAKIILAPLPNIEAVTFLVAAFSYVFGWQGVVATAIFVAIEPMIWGFGTWVISYAIYWPLLAAVFLLLGKIKLKNRIAITGVALLLTLFFGVLTSLVDVGLFSGSYDRFFARFAVYYARGVMFYILQLATNAVLFPILFRRVTDRLCELRQGS